MIWQTKKLGEISKIFNGGTPDTKNLSYWGKDHFWITPKDMGALSDIYVSETPRKISDAGLINSSAKILPPKSVILSSRAPIGHLAINTVPMATNQGCKGLVPKMELDHLFLYYFLFNSVELLNSLGSGTTFKELSGSKLANVQIPLPPLPEQHRIVKILDEVFEKTAKAKAIAEKNLKNTKGLFESYLQSIFAKPGKDWEHCLLNDHVKFIDYRGRTPKKTEAGLRLITAKNIKMGFLQREPEEFIDPKDYEGWMTRGIPRKGDVLFTTEAPLGNVAQLDTDEKVAFAQRTIIFQPDHNKLDQVFLKYLLLSTPVQKMIIEKGTGATVKGIKARLLKLIPIYFPSVPEQKTIVVKLDALSAETKKLEAIYEKKLANLEELKKTVLKKAFNSKL